MVDKRSRQVRRMFASIARRYDLLNRVLSLSIDQSWRRRTRRVLTPFLSEDSLVLDLCTGTADLAIEMAKVAPVVGCDFCYPMLRIGQQKVESKGLSPRIGLAEGDALRLPFPTSRFDALTIAFGVRNLEDLDQGLREMHRVLKPQGRLAILEFSVPELPVLRALYLFYFTRVLPLVGALVSGKDGPYSYLPESVREFPPPAKLADRLRAAGFSSIQNVSLTGGIATLTVGRCIE